MELSDVQIKVKWVNDEKIRKTLAFADYPVSELATEAWLRKSANDMSRKDFIVCLAADHTRIGFCGIKNIDLTNLKAETYMCIGDVNFWGKGFGLEIKKTLLEYSFTHLNLNKIYSYHQANNDAMIRINLKLRGHNEGLLREEVRQNGVLIDMVRIGILKKEYYQ